MYSSLLPNSAFLLAFLPYSIITLAPGYIHLSCIGKSRACFYGDLLLVLFFFQKNLLMALLGLEQ